METFFLVLRTALPYGFARLGPIFRAARPVIFYGRGATCRQPYVKGLTIAANSVFNGWRMEDVWLDK